MDQYYENGNKNERKRKHFLLWLAIIIPFLIVGTVVGILIINQLTSNESGSSDATIEIPTQKGLVLAEQIIASVHATIPLNGNMPLYYECALTPNGECTETLVDAPQRESSVIMALHEIGTRLGNTTYTTTARRLVDASLILCEKGELSHCEWQFLAFDAFYAITGDERYKKAMLKTDEILLADYSYEELVDRTIPARIYRLYDVTGDKKYLDRLVTIADETLRVPLDERTNNAFIYFSGDYQVRERSLQTIWAIYVPAYEATGDEKYLRAAQEFFAEANVGERARYRSIGGVAAMLLGSDALFTLAKLDPENAAFYRSEATGLLSDVLQASTDTAENEKATGDYMVIVEKTKYVNLTGFLALQLATYTPDQLYELAVRRF